jgi:hypothetical protein
MEINCCGHLINNHGICARLVDFGHSMCKSFIMCDEELQYKKMCENFDTWVFYTQVLNKTHHSPYTFDKTIQDLF